MEVESSATAAITASTNTPTEEETMQETSAMAEGLIQGKKRAASVDDDEEADQGKLVIDEQLDNQAKTEQGATDAKEDGTEGQGTSQDDGAAEGEAPATGKGRKGAAAKKGAKRARKETPAQAKTRAVRASRRRERSAAAITKIRLLVPGTGPRTDHTRVIENLLAYLHFFSQAIDTSDLETFQNTFSIAKSADPSTTCPPVETTESTYLETTPIIGDDITA